MNVSKDGKKVLAGSADMTVQLIDTETFQCKKFEGHEAPILNVALDPKLEYILSSSCDGSVKIWKIETASCVKVSFLFIYILVALFVLFPAEEKNFKV